MLFGAVPYAISYTEKCLQQNTEKKVKIFFYIYEKHWGPAGVHRCGVCFNVCDEYHVVRMAFAVRGPPNTKRATATPKSISMFYVDYI